MSHTTDLRSEEFIEGTTPEITYTLQDEAGATITAALDTQTATIYNRQTGAALPTWTADTNIDGAQGNLVTSGVGVWLLPTTATTKTDSAQSEELVIAIEFTYNSGRVGKHWLLVRVIEQPV